MNLSSPVTVTPPDIIRNGEVKKFNPITITEIDITILDNAKRKIAMAQIRPFPKPLVLWKDQEYTAAGDYTQSQVESRVLELLGNQPANVLRGLFIQPRTTPQPTQNTNG